MSNTNNKDQLDFNVNIESRVGRVEGALETVLHEVSETSKSVREVSAGLSTFREEVLAHIGKATAPKWPLIAGVLTLVLTILTMGGGIGGMILSGINGNVTRLDNIIARADEQAKLDRFEDGKNVIWRENISKSYDEKSRELQEQQKEFLKWRLEHEEKNARSHGKTDAEIEMLIKALEKVECRQFEIKTQVSSKKPE